MSRKRPVTSITASRVPPHQICRLATLRGSVQHSRERFYEASPTGKFGVAAQ